MQVKEASLIPSFWFQYGGVSEDLLCLFPPRMEETGCCDEDGLCPGVIPSGTAVLVKVYLNAGSRAGWDAKYSHFHLVLSYLCMVLMVQPQVFGSGLLRFCFAFPSFSSESWSKYCV